MATNPDSDSDAQFAGKIGVDEEKVVEELIFNQAEGIADAIRELIQNGVDAPGSSSVTVAVTPEKTVVEDDGDGMELTDEQVREFLTQLGMSTKRDDDGTIGRFGIGFGQALAKGRVTAQSGTTVAEFDAKEWFRDYKLYEADESVDGFRVEIEHYEEDVPDADSTDWDDIVDDVADRFKFMELVHDVAIEINGEVVSDKTTEDAMTGDVEHVYDDDQVHIALKTSEYADWIRVYSAGLKITSNRGDGISGYVITRENLDVNTARNSIQEGCEVWAEVEAKLADAKAELLAEQDSYGESARKCVASMLAEGRDEFADEPVFKDANGEMRSYEEIQEKDEVIWASADDPFASKLADRGENVLLDSDRACLELKRAATRSDEIELPEPKDGEATARALGLLVGHEEVEDDDADKTWELAAARVLAHEMGIDREVKMGEDDTCRAWTDGEETIWITEDSWNRGPWEQWLFQLWRELAHEAAHNEDTKGQPDHGDEFNRQFRQLADKHEPALLDLMDQFKRDGVSGTLRQYEHVHGLDI